MLPLPLVCLAMRNRLAIINFTQIALLHLQVRQALCFIYATACWYLLLSSSATAKCFGSEGQEVKLKF